MSYLRLKSVKLIQFKNVIFNSCNLNSIIIVYIIVASNYSGFNIQAIFTIGIPI